MMSDRGHVLGLGESVGQLLRTRESLEMPSDPKSGRKV